MLTAERDRHRDHPGEQRGAGPPDEPRQHVAPDLVGAEPIDARTAACARRGSSVAIGSNGAPRAERRQREPDERARDHGAPAMAAGRARRSDAGASTWGAATMRRGVGHAQPRSRGLARK